MVENLIFIFVDVILNETGYERSKSHPTMYSKINNYKTVTHSDKPISTCLLDQMKNDAKFSDNTPETINQVFETLHTFEAMVDIDQFFKEASKILQRSINIVDLKGGEQVFKFKSATKTQAEPYHLCFLQYCDYVYQRFWLSITCKNI